eukprot:TRINITY_DN25100_c0_g1_i1.p1 TRINITY_DN25100_c0_g1~~TRINITY_DN25100_c0_g1_i1.p1  ORF type:complete len:174 (+),score=37.86 TRINITY_DN25100_c0_g1_i1:64-585(+)
MPPLHDFYEVLGVNPTSNTAVIKKAYREKVLRCHPDKGVIGCRKEFDKVQSAYEVLGDTVLRSRYDGERKIEKQKSEAKSTRKRPLEEVGRHQCVNIKQARLEAERQNLSRERELVALREALRQEAISYYTELTALKTKVEVKQSNYIKVLERRRMLANLTLKTVGAAFLRAA